MSGIAADGVQTPDSPEQQCRDNQRRIFPAARVMFCPRCGHATGGGYGHFTGWCRANQKAEASHKCCPGSCELLDGPEINTVAACHPSTEDPEEFARWVTETDAARKAAWS